MHGAPGDHLLKVPVDAPGGGHTRQSDRLCTQCHEVAVTHSHHAAESEASRCIACHMSDVNWRLFTRRRDHTFQPPVPELTAKYGAPNACTTCHENKSPEWAAGVMNEWYGNADRRQAVVALADTMYRAGTGDAAVLPDLAEVAVNRSRGSLLRASAAEFAGQLIGRAGQAGEAGKAGERGTAGAQPASTPSSVINALIGAAADPEPMVRVAAVRALGIAADGRAMAAVSAHLTDDSRLVRVSAAEALMAAGISHLEGARGAALANAQEEWAESLRGFNDVAADQTTLGWLDSARGRTADARRELNIAIGLDPAAARPHVYLGVIAAREGRFDEAVQHFTAARSRDPKYPNLSRLIDEASKRAPK
jgi:hypothetical protein